MPRYLIKIYISLPIEKKKIQETNEIKDAYCFLNIYNYKAI